jgi:acyl transferase domain-containing protein/NADPH:quinone reductase-like Zn-dependent oxidoreductase
MSVSPGGAIAIIGLSGRFPGAPDPDAFWDLLVEGRDGVADAPADWPWMRELRDERLRAPGKLPSPRGGFLPGLAMFDAAFFGISPREARCLDPQIRLLLEIALEAAEDAGVPVNDLAGPATGVFVGGLHNDYWLRQIGGLDSYDLYTEMGAEGSSQAGRVAYAFGLRGPAVVVDTACASSLTAVHLACSALRARECDAALAGAAAVILSPLSSIAFASAGTLSPDGRCRFGDARANGFVRSEGAGMVLLKRLADAAEAGDRIRAVILGSATNNDGFTGAGLGAPNYEAKVEVMRTACARAGIDPAELHFIEAHGTGTVAGDEGELRALAELMSGRPAARHCVLGSAKASVGHAEPAAGMVGLIKAVLTLEHRLVPALPFLERPTDVVDWDRTALLLPREPVPLPSEGRLLAAVNSFGSAGTNVQVVLTAAQPLPLPLPHEDIPDGAGTLLPLSARTPRALRELADRYRELLGGATPPAARILCAAAATRRDHYEHRLAVTGDTAAALAGALTDFLAGTERPSIAVGAVGERPRIVFVCPGQGGQWAGMGRELLDRGGAFADTLTACAEVIAEHGGFSLVDLLRSDDEQWLEQTGQVQPALWAVGAALAAQWHAWGIVPDAVIGYSQGEILAAHLAGALTLTEAGRLSCLRARLAAAHATPGAMCRVELPEHELGRVFDAAGVRVGVAVEEGPTSAVLSGETADIDRVLAACARLGVDAAPIRVAYAAHSSGVEPVRAPLLAALDGLTPRRTEVRFVSTVTGGDLPGTALDAPYWWRNLRETVRLDDAVRTVLADGPAVFLQISPHPVLSGVLAATGAPALASLRRHAPELSTLHRSLAVLYTTGLDPVWQAVLGRPSVRIDLPHYPWQRDYHWKQSSDYPWPPLAASPPAEAEPGVAPRLTIAPAGPGRHPLLGQWRDDRWETVLAGEERTFLSGHRVGGRAVLAGAVQVEFGLALAAGFGSGAVREVDFSRLTEVEEDGTELRVCLLGGRVVVTAREGGAGEWAERANMLLDDTEATNQTRAPAPLTLAQIRDRCPDWRPGERFYREHERTGNDWRGAFRGIAELWSGNGEALARLRTSPAADGFRIPPAALDCCLQLTAVVLKPAGDRGFFLRGIDRVRLHRTPVPADLWAHARSEDGLSASVAVLTAGGELVAELTGVRTSGLSAGPHDDTAAESRGEPPPGPAVESALGWRPVAFGRGGATPGRWLLIPGGSPLDAIVTTSLRAAGAVVTPAGPDRDALTAAISGSPDGVVCLAGPGCAADADASTLLMRESVIDLCGILLTQLRALHDLWPEPGRLFVITQGAQDATAEDGCPNPWQAALWGMVQTAALELPRLWPVLLDLDESPDPEALAALLLSATGEDRLALRGGTALAPRLYPADPVPEAASTLALRTPGGAAGLRLIPANRPRPGPGEVEIEVGHAALNFYDVLEIIRARDGDQVLGMECSGTIARLGTGVTGFAVGDPVMAGADPAMRAHVVVDARRVLHKPESLTPAEAAAFPVAHGTAYYALVELARLRAGERVLIHHGTGGLGLAAIGLARRRGATVYATAGSQEKRAELLRLGVAGVADSRSLSFADELRVEGGMDAILGALTGEAVEANFGLLGPFGKYLNVARRDIAAGRPLSMSQFAPGRAFIHVDLLELQHRAPDAFARILREAVADLDGGLLDPPRVRVFPAEAAADAFTLMMRSAHRGKLVLAFPTVGVGPASVRPDRTYLVTGGLSGLGGLTASWLADRGARHLLLTGRADPVSDPERLALLSRLRASGAEVEYAQVDAGNEPAMARLLDARTGRGWPAVAGVVHAAAVLDPVPLTVMTATDLAQTLHPKVAGGWTLHRLFHDADLDFFVLYSSIAAVLGGLRLGSQLGAYAAGNAFLDSLARHRSARGLPATVVNWGYWTGTGIAHRLSERTGTPVHPPGLRPYAPADAPAVLSRALSTSGRLFALRADWPAYLAGSPGDANAPILRDFLSRGSVSEPGDSEPSHPERSRPASPSEPAALELETWLVRGFAQLLDLPADQIDPHRPINRLGVDSLMAAEITTRFRREHGRDLTVPAILRARSIRALATDLNDDGHTRQRSPIGQEGIM